MNKLLSKQGSFNYIIYGLASVLLGGWLFLCIRANSDLLLPHALFMDEGITFDGIKKIFASENPIELVKNIVGRDFRYGRPLWYISAFFSYLPYKVFGDPGIIFSTRMTQVLFLTMGFLLFSFGLIKNKFAALTCFFVFLCVDATSYFVHMPKPEAMQLCFLGAFFVCYFQKRDEKIQLIFLGIAFGMKISILPVVGLYFAIYLMSEKWDATRSRIRLKRFFLFFFLGFLISNPEFFWPKGIIYYFKMTFGNLGHGADSPDVTVISWLNYIWETYSFLSLLLLFPAVYWGRQLLVSIEFSTIDSAIDSFRKFLNKCGPSFYLALSGYALLFPVILFVHRLWPHYLFIASILLISSFFIAASKILKGWRSVFLYACLLVSFAYIAIPFRIEEYARLASRTQQEEFIKAEQNYQKIVSFLSTFPHVDRRLLVAYDPTLFLPVSTSKYKIKRFWGAFTSWQKKYDILIMDKERLVTPPEADQSKLANATRVALKEFWLHVEKPHGTENATPIYSYRPISDSVYAFVRE